MHRNGRPVIVTANGKPDAVLRDVDVFEKKLKALNLGLLLAEAEAEVKKGNARPAKDFLKEFKPLCLLQNGTMKQKNHDRSTNTIYSEQMPTSSLKPV